MSKQMIGKNYPSGKWDKAIRGIVSAVCILIVLGFVAMTMPSWFRARPKANKAACMQQLKNIASGMEQLISEKGSLRGVKSGEDVCHHILSDYETPKGCIGKVKARVDEVCLKDSLNVKVLDEMRYEIRAKANEKSQCNICVTESAVRPTSYDPKGECQKSTCIHTSGQ